MFKCLNQSFYKKSTILLYFRLFFSGSEMGKATTSTKCDKPDDIKKFTKIEKNEKNKIEKTKITKIVKEIKVIKPKRENGVFLFEDQPQFRPNMSPKEVIQAGSFGGTYFRPIKSGVTKQTYGAEVWQELPKDWLEGLDIKKKVASPIYDTNVNTYKVKCGSSLEAWESSNWIKAQDPYGWFQWYCRFFQGRRSEDDERQIGRWLRCAGETGRWKNNLISKIFKAGTSFDNKVVSPVVRQVLQHWAYKLTEEDYKKRASKLKK